MKKSFLLSLGLSTLALGACELTAPYSMPSGYTYHHDEYKSATPPDSFRVSTEQRKYMDAAQAEQFRRAVYTLLERVTQRAGLPPKPVYILQPKPLSIFYANIDNDLREAMRSMGYALSDLPTGAYIFTYDAMLIGDRTDRLNPGASNVELTLKVFNKMGRDARILTKESGQYYIQGAENLYIKPANYNAMPSYYDLKQQESGFDLMENEPRTATEIGDDISKLETLVMPKNEHPVFPTEEIPQAPIPAESYPANIQPPLMPAPSSVPQPMEMNYQSSSTPMQSSYVLEEDNSGYMDNLNAASDTPEPYNISPVSRAVDY
jgi:hypothetical protein